MHRSPCSISAPAAPRPPSCRKRSATCTSPGRTRPISRCRRLAVARSRGGRMVHQGKKRRIVARGLALLLLLGPSTPALAESAAERRLRILEEELRKTQEEMKALHRQLDEQKAVAQETRNKA